MIRSFENRPVIFDYESVPQFVNDMLAWRRAQQDDFSIRAASFEIPGCSPALVTQVAKGKRRLTRDRVGAFAALLSLTSQESKYLDQWIEIERSGGRIPQPKRQGATGKARRPKQPQTKIVHHWLNAYVKEASRLAGFRPDPFVIHRLLGGLASLDQITRSLDFLLREGFLRRNLKGKVVLSETVCTTTDEVPNAKVRAFHKKALDIAKRGIDLFPIQLRKSDAYILAVNEKNLPKIKKILTECMDQIEQFEEDHPEDNERLYQVLINLTPVGSGGHGKH